MNTGRSQQFQVDLRGIVDLLSRHIYSGPRVFLRELMQNACDAITARAEFEASTSPAGMPRQSSGIRITPLSDRSDEFIVRDDGIGLTASEVTDLLATVGRSSKRDIFDLPRSDFLLWQSAHSEFYFVEALGPDLREVDFLRAIRDFGDRDRRFGS